MTTDAFTAWHETYTDYEQLWQRPEVRVMMHRHFVEQLNAGIFATYNASVRELITESDVYDIEDPERLAQDVIAAEFPLALAADVPEGMDEGDKFEHASPLFVLKVNPDTGKGLYGSILSVGEIEDQKPTKLYSLFTREQANLLLLHGKEQASLGLHPRHVYCEYTR